MKKQKTFNLNLKSSAFPKKFWKDQVVKINTSFKEFDIKTGEKLICMDAEKGGWSGFLISESEFIKLLLNKELSVI